MHSASPYFASHLLIPVAPGLDLDHSIASAATGHAAARAALPPQNSRRRGGIARWRQNHNDTSEVTHGNALMVAWSAADRSG
jgi:hypothetical protein